MLSLRALLIPSAPNDRRSKSPVISITGAVNYRLLDGRLARDGVFNRGSSMGLSRDYKKFYRDLTT